MTKKELIIKSWTDLNIETPFGICENTGWFHGYFCNGITDIESVHGNGISDLIDYDIDMYGIGKFRPKSLKGIEHNEGWIKIESEEDLPKLKNEYHVVRNGDIQKALYSGKNRWFVHLRDFPLETDVAGSTHYQPIIEPNPPIY